MTHRTGTECTQTRHLVHQLPRNHKLVLLLDLLGPDKQSVHNFPGTGYT
jgi:hypothetical protein